MMIYFDNAATTEMSEPALAALIEASKKIYGNASSVYAFGRTAKKLLEDARETIALCIGADADEVYFTSGGTESDNWVVNQGKNIVDRIIASSIEHHAVLRPFQSIPENEIKTSILPVDFTGVVRLEALESILDNSKSLVSIMLQNNETGVLQDIQSLASIVHKDNPQSLFHTDAVQAVGHREINVHKLGVDLLSASAHKFNGPKGVGFLYIRKECRVLSPFILGGGQEKGLRSGTENIPGIYAMAKALEDNVTLLRDNDSHVSLLEKRLMNELSLADIPYKINGDVHKKATGIINISISGIDAEGLLNFLDLHEICVSIGSACNSKSKKRSHVLLAMGIDEERIDSSIRISIGRYNKEMEIIELVKWIKKYYELTQMIK